MGTDDREAQYLEEHGAEAHGAGPRDTPGFGIAHAETFFHLPKGQLLALSRHKRPERRPEETPQSLAKAPRQMAAEPADGFQKIIRGHITPSLSILIKKLLPS